VEGVAALQVLLSTSLPLKVRRLGLAVKLTVLAGQLGLTGQLVTAHLRLGGLHGAGVAHRILYHETSSAPGSPD